MSKLAGIEEEKKQYQEQLDIVHYQLRDDPENVELKALVEELNGVIALLDENIAELQPKKTEPAKPAAPEPAAPEPALPEKWSRENHPAFKKAAAPEEKDETSVNYQVNDTVLAKWVSGDRAFYPARITSITGSSTAPIYTIKFKDYDNTETIRAKDIRPISNKRKADGTPAASAPAAAAAPGLVSSAGATMYPEAIKDGQKDGDASKNPKSKKIKAKRELEASKSKWQEFNAKSKIAKTKKKESMFRTPEGINGRVELQELEQPRNETVLMLSQSASRAPGKPCAKTLLGSARTIRSWNWTNDLSSRHCTIIAIMPAALRGDSTMVFWGLALWLFDRS